MYMPSNDSTSLPSRENKASAPAAAHPTLAYDSTQVDCQRKDFIDKIPTTTREP